MHYFYTNLNKCCPGEILLSSGPKPCVVFVTGGDIFSDPNGDITCHHFYMNVEIRIFNISGGKKKESPNVLRKTASFCDVGVTNSASQWRTEGHWDKICNV